MFWIFRNSRSDITYNFKNFYVKTLNIPQRATITNMGAELGATTSIFPSDEVTYEFLKKQNREIRKITVRE